MEKSGEVTSCTRCDEISSRVAWVGKKDIAV